MCLHVILFVYISFIQISFFSYLLVSAFLRNLSTSYLLNFYIFCNLIVWFSNNTTSIKYLQSYFLVTLTSIDIFGHRFKSNDVVA